MSLMGLAFAIFRWNQQNDVCKRHNGGTIRRQNAHHRPEYPPSIVLDRDGICAEVFSLSKGKNGSFD